MLMQKITIVNEKELRIESTIKHRIKVMAITDLGERQKSPQNADFSQYFTDAFYMLFFIM